VYLRIVSVYQEKNEQKLFPEEREYFFFIFDLYHRDSVSAVTQKLNF
jgi:hypothetical protein